MALLSLDTLYRMRLDDHLLADGGIESSFRLLVARKR